MIGFLQAARVALAEPGRFQTISTETVAEAARKGVPITKNLVLSSKITYSISIPALEVPRKGFPLVTGALLSQEYRFRNAKAVEVRGGRFKCYGALDDQFDSGEDKLPSVQLQEVPGRLTSRSCQLQPFSPLIQGAVSCLSFKLRDMYQWSQFGLTELGG